MADQLDKDLFEDVPYQEDLFEDVEYDDKMVEEELPSKLESALAGAVQGLTFDFGDEIYGRLASLGGDTYELERDRARRYLEKAEQENPLTYAAADIASGVGAGLLTGGAGLAGSIGKTGLKQIAKTGAKTGAKFGALAGAGAAKEMEDIPESVAKGAALGGALGGVLPAGAKAVGQAGELTYKGAKYIPVLGEFVKSAEYAAKGKSVKDINDIIKKVDNLSENLLNQTKKNYNVAKDKYSRVLDLAQETIPKKNVNKTLNKIEEVVKDLKKRKDEDSLKLATKMEDELNLLKDRSKIYKEVPGELVDEFRTKINTYRVGPKVKSPVEEAIKSLEKKEAKALKKLEMKSNEDFRFSEPEVDLDRNVIGSREILTDKIIVEPIKTGIKTPIRYKEVQEFLGKVPRKEKTFERMGAKEIKELQKRFSNIVAGTDKTTEGFKLATIADKELKKELKEQLSKNPSLARILKNANLEYVGQKELKDLLSAFKKDSEVSKIDAIGKFLLGTDEITKQRTYQKILDRVKGLDPKFGDELAETVDRAELSGILEKTVGERRPGAVLAGDFLGKRLQGLAPAADVVEKTASTLSDIPVTSSISRKVASDKGATTETSDSEIQTLIDNPRMEPFRATLEKALNSEGSEREQILYGLKQQPAFRKLTK